MADRAATPAARTAGILSRVSSHSAAVMSLTLSRIRRLFFWARAFTKMALWTVPRDFLEHLPGGAWRSLRIARLSMTSMTSLLATPRVREKVATRAAVSSAVSMSSACFGTTSFSRIVRASVVREMRAEFVSFGELMRAVMAAIPERRSFLISDCSRASRCESRSRATLSLAKRT
jgi:hypothetical protein